ncbi:MAG: hypothetical protein OEY23_13175 [Acidimicrobiia bacterium]|nr:hypothetical protein [Acidimicrobiia bacterium]
MPKLREPDLSEPVTLDVDERCRITFTRLGLRAGERWRATSVGDGAFLLERVEEYTTDQLDLIRRLDAGGRQEVLDAIAEADAGDTVPWSDYKTAMRALLQAGETDPFAS